MTTPSWTCWRNPTHEVEAHPRLGWPRCTECGAAPAYHERGNYLPEGLVLTIYVPVSNPVIAPGSGVVGHAPTRERIVVYYEGWVHGAMQYADRDARGRWEASVEVAADRLVTEYPTVAVAALPTDQLHPIGTFNPRTREIVVDDEQALREWTGVSGEDH